MRVKVMIAAVLLAAAPLSQSRAGGASPTEMHAIDKVFANAEYAPKLKAVQFFFGDQPHPAVGKKLGPVHTIRRTNGFGKDSESACQRAFASALLVLSDTAIKKGGDAVINIHSAFGVKDEASTTEYLCGVGGVFVGLSLTGDIVKLQ